MAALLPGFGQFRYPGKLLPFVVLAVAGLAGLGWDRLAEGQTLGPSRWCRRGLAVTLAVAALATSARPWLTAFLARRLVPDSAYGPIDLPAALDATRRALIHGGV